MNFVAGARLAPVGYCGIHRLDIVVGSILNRRDHGSKINVCEILAALSPSRIVLPRLVNVMLACVQARVIRTPATTGGLVNVTSEAGTCAPARRAMAEWLAKPTLNVRHPMLTPTDLIAVRFWVEGGTSATS